jgi:hypothetical protein
VSSLSFVLKDRGLEDTTQSSIIQKIIKGANKLYGRANELASDTNGSKTSQGFDNDMHLLMLLDV